MVDRFEKFSYAISEISRLWHKIAAFEMKKYGLKGPYAVYFTTLYRNAEGITAARLCELCGRDKADVSRALSIMESKGLIRKEGVDGKLYRAKLFLTEQGKTAAEHINSRAKLAVDFGGQGLTDQERKTMYSSLERILANLQILSEQGIPL